MLLLSCPDQPGIVAAIADFVYRHGGNIVDAQQHTDRTDGVFFQRVEFLLDGCDLARDEIEPAFRPIVERFDMQCAVRFSDDVPRVGVLVSREAHCLVDLLARSRRGELADRRPGRDLQPRRPRRGRASGSASSSCTCRSRPTRSRSRSARCRRCSTSTG